MTKIETGNAGEPSHAREWRWPADIEINVNARSHCCRTMQELVDQTFDWLTAHDRFKIESSHYRSPNQNLTLSS